MRIALCLVACVASARADRAAFHAKDWKIVVDLQAILRPVDMRTEEWIRLFQPSGDAERQAIGFHATRVSVARYGEETTFHATMVERGGRVVAVRIEAWVLSKARLARLKTAWGESVHAIRGGMAYRWEDPERTAALRADIDRELGTVKTEEIPETLRAPFALLLDPARTFDFGLACYESGEPPAGSAAIDALVAAKRDDLVRAVLRSPNPEARLHAALGLLRGVKKTGNPLDADDAKAIAKLRDQRITVHCCDGCLVSAKKPGEALDEMLQGFD